MRITFVCASLDLSGGARIISTYAKMLADHGHHVTVVAPLPDPLPLRKRLRSLWDTGRWDPHYGTRSHFDGLGLDIRRTRRAPVLEAEVPDADVIIATWWETAEWANAFSAKKGTKVYLVQGHEVFDFLPVERSRATYHMPFFKIVVSGWLQRIMADEYGDHHTALVPNSIDHSMFDARPREKQPVPTVGFMYAIGGIKGADVALDAIKRLRAALPALRVISFGTHTPVGIDGFEGIEFSRLPSVQELQTAYASCDVWLCPGRSEGFGLPAMEAMGCRTPVVSTRVGWPLDAIRDGSNGYLVPAGDGEAMFEAALKCLTLEPQAWKQMSESAQQTAHAYTWDKSYVAFAAALEQAVARDGKAAVSAPPPAAMRAGSG
ncbi:MAG TPA: glycosyltransferase family 4 protein [Burkholderiaceae bacterium]|nr:glycosyltransferase family 4 protein [Burkholderiaceae bacterium]